MGPFRFWRRRPSVQLSTDAWLIRYGFPANTVPGELKRADGRLSFMAFGFGTLSKRQLDKLERDACQPGLADRMAAGENTVVFDVPLTDAEVAFPWHEFSTLLKVRAGGVQYRLDFAAPPPPEELIRIPGDTSALRVVKELLELRKLPRKFQELGKARRLREAWKNALNKQS